MRASRLLLSTMKETPADAEIISHQLMLRAGLIRKLAAGMYTWLPIGLRVLRKVENIVREEMDKSGAQEVLMPLVQPAELWQESGRWQAYGPELLRIKDRHQRDFCLGPTHEEVITALIRNEINSYKQLPANFYQIQTKFRDEIRPRFGIMRSREFIMKDAYSFHIDEQSLQQTYNLMYQTYCVIFDRININYRAVSADSGAIGGSSSHEFHILADSGEDEIAFSDSGDYAANIELAEALAPLSARPNPTVSMTAVDTPGQATIEAVSQYLKVPVTQSVKTLIVLGKKNNRGEQPLVALVLRGDHTLNATKAEKLDGIAKPLTFAPEDRIERELSCKVGSLGPVNLPLTLFVDRSAAQLADFVCGANREGVHLTGVNWERDTPPPNTVDIRNIETGDPSPCGNGKIKIKRGIEVGHIFQLGTKYSEAMNATILDENGAAQPMVMGCYGIGVSRIVAAAIEQNHDDKGIIWPDAIAPFQLALIPINLHKSALVSETCENLYRELTAAGYDILYMDERNVRLGAMLADTELMGIPHRVVIGERGLSKNTIEYKNRRDQDSQEIAADNIMTFLATVLEKKKH